MHAQGSFTGLRRPLCQVRDVEGMKHCASAGLFLCRAAVGLGEGVAPSASTDMLARLVDTRERSRATSYMFGGLHVGSLLGLLVAPALIETFGWQTVRHMACCPMTPHCHS